MCCCSVDDQSIVKCEECGYKTCPSCVEKYLTSITSDAHCMNCRCLWDILFLRKNMTVGFLEGVFRQRRMELLQHRSYRIQCQEIMGPCPSCSFGKIMKSTMSCSSCWMRLCPDCFQVKSENHVCQKEIILSLEVIQQTTKKCPSCHVPIEKKSGCFQMFCTHCHTAFDWNKNVLLEKNIHNPHYFEYCFQSQKMETFFEKKLHNMTSVYEKRKYKEFYYLFCEIKNQMEIYSQQCRIPSSVVDLYKRDLLQQQHQCQFRIWSGFYKRALQLISSSSIVSSSILSFQHELQETLLDYNEHVAECLQLRGYRLFACNSV